LIIKYSDWRPFDGFRNNIVFARLVQSFNALCFASLNSSSVNNPFAYRFASFSNFSATSFDPNILLATGIAFSTTPLLMKK